MPSVPTTRPATDPSADSVPLTFHHIGIAVRSIEETLDYYTGLFGFRPVAEPLEVPAENVRVCFVEAEPGIRIELVEGLEEGTSPVAGVLERNGPTPYHLCYQVEDLDGAVRRLRSRRCRLLQRFEHPAHGLRRFAFLAAPDGQLFELCEAEEPAVGRRANPSGRYTFKTLFFETTRRCNLSCPMCMTGSDDHRRVKRNAFQELTTDEVERHILATAQDIGIQTIAWSGGEFLVRRDAVELVRRATSYGYESTVCSNALLVDRQRLRELDEASGGTLVMALGINSIENESSWTRDNDCDRTLEVLDLCAELGIRRHVVVNVGRHNLSTLEPTLQWLEEHGIPYNRSPFTPRGSGRGYWDQLRFDRDDMESTLHPALRRHPIGYISYTPFFLSPELHARVSGGEANVTAPQNPPIGCWCGSWIAVNAEGEVAPCGILLDEVQCGNVREKTLERIVDDSPVFQRVLDRSRLKGKCGRCRYKLTCGGCRAMAFFHSGDLMAEDPTCFFEPVDESTVCEHEEETNRRFRHYLFMIRRAERARARMAAKAQAAREARVTTT